MKIEDRGSGAPVVLVPGIQGRWEWMQPAVDALAERCRVITYSFADEPSAEWTARGAGFDAYVEQVAQALDASGLERATICGVSYGGLIASAFALRHPERASGLALVSAVPPSWKPDSRVQFYARNPRILYPLFLLGALRLHREIAAATVGRFAGYSASLRQAVRALTHFPAPTRMARRVGLAADAALDGLSELRMPTLVVTGEPHLDRVVPPALTAEYARLWPHAQTVTLARTGHLGLVTRPDAFADALVPFVDACHRTELSRRRVG
jgi:pimeloyl-ACP methyl ester carboxylesterase